MKVRLRTALPGRLCQLSEVHRARAGLSIGRAMPTPRRDFRAWLTGWARPVPTGAIPPILVERPYEPQRSQPDEPAAHSVRGLFRSSRLLIQHKIAVTGTSRSLAADLIHGGSAVSRHRA
jgi:hypothetical protein